MQHAQQLEQSAGIGGAERRRVEAVVETLATLGSEGESLAEVAHDARNMVTALGLYCDLLQEPGVLATQFMHYGNELRLVAAASRRLMERLADIDHRDSQRAEFSERSRRDATRLPAEATTVDRLQRSGHWDVVPTVPIDNLAAELLANRNLLSALAGPSIALTVDAESGALPVHLTGEDLTRVLVNLVKNSAEAMPGGGRVQIGLRESAGESETALWLELTVEDNGPGIHRNALDWVFESGYTTRAKGLRANEGWPAAHRGLGLSITRSIVEAAGGHIRAADHAPAGARFEIELPVRTR